ncbi:MAG: PAS domain-containing sensor histidine kinase [Nitrospirae bacterium]|nr:PAS domain-containing sensor histidine kinase [Nitrospirota bacterium]
MSLKRKIIKKKTQNPKLRPSSSKLETENSRLRKSAEKKIKERPGELKAISMDTNSLIHELQVHQIELEMQNEELRKSRAEIEESRARYSDLYDFAPAGYFTLDKNGLILEVNLTGTSLLWADRGRLIKKPFTGFIHHNDKDVYYLKSNELFRTKEKQSCDIRLVRKDGSIFYARIECILAKDSVGDQDQIRMIVSDISERKKAEEDKERLNRELEQMIYVTSHDLRSPLVNIEGYSREIKLSLDELQSALQDGAGPETLKNRIARIIEKDIPESMDYITKSIFKMDSLLSALHQISRSGKTEFEAAGVDMNSLVRDVISTLEHQFKEKGATHEISKLPSCICDKKKINQVMTNLIGNALRYLDPKRPGVIKVSGGKKNGQIVYCVADNGIGIAKEDMDKVFDIFYRVSSDKKGEGLGLSIVKKVVEMHGGKVWLESEPGKGSAFCFSIPDGDKN